MDGASKQDPKQDAAAGEEVLQRSVSDDTAEAALAAVPADFLAATAPPAGEDETAAVSRGNSPRDDASKVLRRSFSVRKPLLQQASSLALHRHDSGESTASRAFSSGESTTSAASRRGSWVPLGLAEEAIELLVAGGEEKVSAAGACSASVLATFGLFQQKQTKRDEGNRQPTGSMILESPFDLTPERIGHIFQTLDTNKDGMVSYDALKRGIEEWAGMGANAIDEATITTLTSFLDADNSGDISLVEFTEGLRLLTLHVLFSEPDTPGVQFECFDYNAVRYQRNLIPGNAREQAEFMYGSREDFVSCRWVNIGGNGPDASLTLLRLAVKYLLHPLAIEDAFFASEHRPKVEVFSSHYFLQVPYFTLVVDNDPDDGVRGIGDAHKDNNSSNDTTTTTRDEANDGDGELSLRSGSFHITCEIISVFVNVPFNDTLITFQRRQIDDPKCCQFKSLRKQIKKSYSKLRQYSAQYLAYALLDMAVDRLPKIAERLEKYVKAERDRQRVNGYEDTSHNVEAIKENLRKTLRQIKPFLRVLNHVIQDDKIVPGATLYLRDVRDNLECAQDDLRELVNSCDQLDIEFEKYHARQQDKTLYLMTVVTSIFLPAQFLTGVWGMNFDDMPELKQAWGYPLFWILCIVMTTALLVHFRCGRLLN